MAGGTLPHFKFTDRMVLTVPTEAVADSAEGLAVEIEVASHLVAVDGECACDFCLSPLFLNAQRMYRGGGIGYHGSGGFDGPPRGGIGGGFGGPPPSYGNGPSNGFGPPGGGGVKREYEGGYESEAKRRRY